MNFFLNSSGCANEIVVSGDEVSAVDSDGRIEVMKQMLKEKDQQLLTKKGEPRKRKSFALSKKEREILKTKIKEAKRCVKKSCLHKTCLSAISEKQRRDINHQFWNLNFSARAAFVHSRVECKHRKPNSKGLRRNTFSYHLKNDTGRLRNVCKIFYLTTLGYSKSNDSFIRALLGKENFMKPLRVRSEQGKHTKDTYDRPFSHHTPCLFLQSFNFTSSSCACTQKELFTQ